MNPLSEIEQTVKQTQRDMQQFITSSRSHSLSESEVQSMRSQPSSLGTNDSRRLMDDHVIDQALHLRDVEHHQTDAATASAADLSSLSPLKRRLSQMMDGFREIEDSPKIYTGTRPKSKESTPTNTIPSAPPINEAISDVVSTTSPLIERSQNVLFKFLPQLSQSVFGNLEETMMLKPCSAL